VVAVAREAELFYFNHDDLGGRFADVYANVGLRIRPHHVTGLELAYQLFTVGQHQFPLVVFQRTAAARRETATSATAASVVKGTTDRGRDGAGTAIP
jgi:hypothetical protein